MKKLLLATSGLIALLAAPAFAADINMPLKAPIMPSPAFSWTGFYIGGNVGGKWADTDGSVAVAPSTFLGTPVPGGAFGLASTTSSTLVGGGQLGYNYQMGNVVFGIEGDVDAHNWNASRTAAGAGIPTPFVAGDNFTASGDWQASLRGRLGYAWDRTLLYVTGGVAWTDVKVGTNFIAIGGFPGSSASDSKVVTGGTIGGGLEYAFTRNWSAGIEGRFTWYGTETYNGGTLATFGIPTTGPFTMAPVSQSLRLSTSEILGKLNFRF